MKFSTLAERQILKAQTEGQFDHLEGAGKPLSGEGGGSVEAVGFRIMAEAGAVPRPLLGLSARGRRRSGSLGRRASAPWRC